MLNKKICSECAKKRYVNGWDRIDEEDWNNGRRTGKGKVWCFCGGVSFGGWVRTEDDPPSQCPYLLEYMFLEMKEQHVK